MKELTLRKIAEACHGTVAPEAETVTVTGVQSDSRRVRPGDLFVAIKGEKADGHDFVAMAASLGAKAALVARPVEAPIPTILVADTIRAYGDLAAAYREHAGITVIGITGSVGKTTTKDLLSSLLATVGPTVAPVGSFNNEIGLPLTALRVDEHTRFFVAEMGASHIGEIARLTRIAPPNTAIVLKVGVAHLGEFGSRERIAQAKSEIVQGLLPGGTAVLNADDEHVVPMAGLANGDVLWFGLGSSQEPEVRAIDVTADRSDHAEFTLVDADGNHTPVHLGIPGRHNVMNALAAATVAMRYGMAPETVARILASQHTISPHRMALSTVNREGTSFTLIDDSFNANPDSMKAGLNGLKAWNSNDGKEPFRVALLGAMLELGADETALHTSIGTYADELGIDAIIAVGSAQDQHLDALAQALADGARQSQSASVDCVHDIDAAEQLVIDLARNHPDAVVLLKGSHASGLSALAERWAKN